VKDQMLARGYISDNAHFPDAEFPQIVAGMRRLKPACDELATAPGANNMASMQVIDKAVLQLVKECGKKLEFVTGRGGAGRVFTRQAPPLQRAGGVILGVIPAPPPSGASPHSFPGWGPVSPHMF